jgi:hypothetical protein
MAETVEVHTTVEGQERAVELAHTILRAGLAHSIDLSPVAGSGAEGGEISTWKLSALTTGAWLAAVEEHFERARCDVVPPLPG